MDRLVEYTSNHPFYVIALLAMLILVVVHEIRQRSLTMFSVSPGDAVRLINRGAVVVDVRPAEAFNGGHIQDARNVPLAELNAQPDTLKKFRKKVVMLVCDNGAQSAKAAAMLHKHGYEKPASLRGGMSAWTNDNLPVAKS